MSAGWTCTLLAERGDVLLEQLDDRGHDWFAEGPAGVAAGELRAVIAEAAAEGTDAEWIDAVAAAIGRELLVGIRRSTLLVKRGEGLMFHASPSENRDSIRRHGLDWRRTSTLGVAGSAEPEWPGIFLCSDMESAEWFAGMSRARTADIWSVRVDGIWLEGAPDADGGGGDDWMIAPEPIGPDRVELIEADIPPRRMP